jgi:hypothetical protein
VDLGGVPGSLLQWNGRRQADGPLGIGLCRSIDTNPHVAVSFGMAP